MTPDTLRAALTEAREQIAQAKKEADERQTAARESERCLFELMTKAWILEARLLELDDDR